MHQVVVDVEQRVVVQRQNLEGKCRSVIKNRRWIKNAQAKTGRYHLEACHPGLRSDDNIVHDVSIRDFIGDA